MKTTFIIDKTYQTTDYLKIRKGMVVSDIQQDYSKEKGQCYLTIEFQDQLSEIDFLKADIVENQRLLEEARKIHDPVGILQLSCRKIELQEKIAELENNA